VIGGIPKCPVVFHDVLHVPELGSNLLSLYHLTQKNGYEISIKATVYAFIIIMSCTLLPQSPATTLGTWMDVLLFLRKL
jgi:hypothetical protein